MYHNVLYLGKFLLYCGVYPFGNIVAFTESPAAVCAYLDIRIYLVSEHPGGKLIYSHNAILRQDTFLYSL